MSDETTELVHELQAPLTVLRTRLEEVLRAPEELPERRLLQDCLEEVQYMQHLVADLLLLGRVRSGHLTEHREAVDLEELVTSLGGMFRRRAASQGVQFALATEGPLVVEGHRSRLERVISNLLDNALKFTPREGTVSVVARPTGSTVEVRVEDTGCGIPASALDLIFNPFYRVDKEADRARRGVGLGLSIARTLAEQNGGTIEVESLPGKGSCFTLKLPRLDLRP